MHAIKAQVISGRGLASSTRKNSTARLSKHLNINLVDGSLNLVSKQPLWLKKETAIYTDKKRHLYWHATLNGTPVIINRWIGDCPVHIFEVYANKKLRDLLDLKDGDTIKLSVDPYILDKNKNSSLKYIITWYLIWFGRETLYYKSLGYLRFLRRKPLNLYSWRAFQR
ncbi:MAG: hypothetical protein QM500_21585 [Methylococcales bacterium]